MTRDAEERIAADTSAVGMGLLLGDAVMGCLAAADWGGACYAQAWSDKERAAALEVGRLAHLLSTAIKDLRAMREDHP